MGRAGTGLIWLGIGTGGGLLLRRQSTVQFHTTCLSDLLAGDERLAFVGVIQYVCRWHHQYGGCSVTTRSGAISRQLSKLQADGHPPAVCAVRNKLPACSSTFLRTHGQTGRTVNEHGRGPMTLGECNQRYQCWASPRHDFILVELRTNI